jgi:hypothetical protein
MNTRDELTPHLESTCHSRFRWKLIILRRYSPPPKRPTLLFLLIRYALEYGIGTDWIRSFEALDGFLDSLREKHYRINHSIAPSQPIVLLNDPGNGTNTPTIAWIQRDTDILDDASALNITASLYQVKFE